MEDKELMQDDINSLSNQKEVLSELHIARETFNKHIERVKEIVENYKPSKEGKARKIETIFKLYKDWLDDSETSTYINDEQRFDEIRKANYKVQSGIKSVLAPRGLGIDFDYEDVIEKIDKDIETKVTLLEEQTGEEAIEAKAQEIIKEREINKVRSTTVEERVKEFSKLNKKVLTEVVLDDKSERRTAKRKKQTERGQDLMLSADLLDDITELESLDNDLRKLETINAELDALLAA
jgi:hypothetical protein